MFSHNLSSALAAVLLFISAANSHMILASPKPFQPTPDNSPLSADGAHFPCKTTGSADFFKASYTENPPMTYGKEYPLEFTGSAVHAGGSCQLAVTPDLAPTASSTWQVILSIEGGCPGIDGGASPFTYKIPEAVKPGKYVFGWTWISHSAGQPEYYMNCAPITVAGGKSKRATDDAFDNSTEPLLENLDRRAASLPNLFVANQAAVNDCVVGGGSGGDPQYPEPGPTIQKPEDAKGPLIKPTGSNCFPKGGKSTPGAAASGTDSSSSAASSGPSAGGASVAQPSGAASSGSASTGASSGASGNDGMYHPDGASSGSSGSSGAAASGSSSAPASSPSTGTDTSGVAAAGGSGAAAGGASSGAASSGAASSGSPSSSNSSGAAAASTSVIATPIAAPTSAAAAAPSAAASTGTASSGAANGNGSTGSTGSTGGGLSGACTSEGMWNCIGGSSFQRCASGQWSPVIPMAAGTHCTAGQSSNFAVARRWVA